MDERLRALERAWASSGDGEAAEALDRARGHASGGLGPMRLEAYARLVGVLHRRCHRCPLCGSTGNTDLLLYRPAGSAMDNLPNWRPGWYLSCASCGAADYGWMDLRDAPWKPLPRRQV